MPKLREIWLKVWPFENNSLTLYHIISFFVEPVVREVFILLFVFFHYKGNEFFPFIMHFLVPSLTFLTFGGFTLPISGGFTLRKFGGAKLLITYAFALTGRWIPRLYQITQGAASLALG
ncbi:MAG: hypothetical protein ACOCOG_07755 [Prevotella sp.]